MTPPEIFDRNARRMRRRRGEPDNFFAAAMIDDLVERLDDHRATFETALVVGAAPQLVAALQSRGIATHVTDVIPGAGVDVICEEDRLDVGIARFDLAVSVAALDTVSDLPGALILMRRALKPGGLLLAAFFAGPSLSTLREVATHADAATGRAAARLHPQVDVRGGGDLLMRAGFVGPVCDLQDVRVRYQQFERAVADLRACAATNCLAQRHAVQRDWLITARLKFEELRARDGGVEDVARYLMLTGRAPEAAPLRPADDPPGAFRPDR